MKLEGSIITGQFDQQKNEFSIEQVKHLTTQSTLKANQVNSLRQYLSKHINDDGGQVVTLYDQIPVRLNQSEIEALIDDLVHISLLYK